MEEIAATVGVEVEFNDFSIDGRFSPLDFPRGWNITRDGSCTRRRPSIGGIGVKVDSDLRRLLPGGQVGGEYVSPPLHYESDKLREDIFQITDILRDNGEHISSLTSTHVHVFMGNLPPVKALKNLLQLAVRIEAPMFRLSVAELLEHRGVEHNDYMYCRPLTGPGPQYVIDEDGWWRQCFDIQRILDKAKTSRDVVRAWGRSDYIPTKWIPPRYYWINLVSLCRQGTIEYRLFNQTLDPHNILAWVNLCVAITKTAYFGNLVELDVPWFPLGNERPTGDTATYRLKDMMSLVSPVFIEEESMDQLHKLWFKSKWQRGVEEQVNHLSKENRYTPMQTVRAELIPEPVPKSYIDEIWNQGYYDRR